MLYAKYERSSAVRCCSVDSKRLLFRLDVLRYSRVLQRITINQNKKLKIKIARQYIMQTPTAQLLYTVQNLSHIQYLPLVEFSERKLSWTMDVLNVVIVKYVIRSERECSISLPLVAQNSLCLGFRHLCCTLSDMRELHTHNDIDSSVPNKSHLMW